MIGLRMASALLIMAAISGCGATAPNADNAPKVVMAPAMEFADAHTGGNCSDCVWIAAEGEIMADTPERLLAFLATLGGPRSEHDVRLHSSGGDLRGALRLGTLFREMGLNTRVGRTVQAYEPPECGGDGPPCDLAISEPGECLGACVYALAGGAERGVSGADRIGLRSLFQEWNSARTDAENETSLAALLGYLRLMGISAEIAEIASRTMPNEISILDYDTLKRTGIANMHWRVADWRIERRSKGIVAVSDVTYGPNYAVTATVFCRTDLEHRAFLTISLDVSHYLEVNPGPLPITGIVVAPSVKTDSQESSRSTAREWQWPLDEPSANDGILAITVDISEKLKELIASDGFSVKMDAAMVFHSSFPSAVILTGVDFPIPRAAVPTLQLALHNCV